MTLYLHILLPIPQVSWLSKIDAESAVIMQARQNGSESLVFEDNDEGDVWELESRVATQPIDLRGTLH